MSAKTNWTKGPWVATQDNHWPWQHKIGNDERIVVVCELFAWSTDDTQETANARPENAECAANAHLIAAAPELYEALHEMIEHAEHSTPQGAHAFTVARAVLSKARGES